MAAAAKLIGFRFQVSAQPPAKRTASLIEKKLCSFVTAVLDCGSGF